MWAFWFFFRLYLRLLHLFILYCCFEKRARKRKRNLLGKEQEREFVIGDRLWDETEIAMNKRETPSVERIR